MWTAILLGGLGCYALKLAGLSVPERVLANPMVSRVSGLLPVALLAALVAVQALGSGQDISFDARLVGLGFAVLALLLRQGFLVVVIGAAVTTALWRAAFGG